MFDHLEFACDQRIWRVLPNWELPLSALSFSFQHFVTQLGITFSGSSYNSALLVASLRAALISRVVIGLIFAFNYLFIP